MELLRRFFKEEDGIGTIELVLILAVLIGLVVVFRKALGDLLSKIWDSITQGTKDSTESQKALPTPIP